MGKKIKRIYVFMLAVMLLVVSVKADIQAAGGLNISASAAEVSEGETFTVTVSASENYFVADISLSVSGGTVQSGLGKNPLKEEKQQQQLFNLLEINVQYQ